MVGGSILIVFAISAFHCSTAVFLRESEDDAQFLRSDRISRAIPEWRDDIRRRAQTFGQSEDEINRVQFYLTKLKEIADQKYSPITADLSVNSQTTASTQVR